MSGDNYYFGDNVNMYDGVGNTGIVKSPSAPADPPGAPPALQEAVQELLLAARDLRDRVSPLNAQAIDDSLPAATTPDGDPTAPHTRHRALMTIAGIATTVGTFGQPALDAINKILNLLNGQ